MSEKNGNPSTVTTKQPRRNRITCDSCHHRHVRCDYVIPCSKCLRRGTPCKYTRANRNRGPVKQMKLNTPAKKATSRKTPAPVAPVVSPEGQTASSSPGTARPRRPSINGAAVGSSLNTNAYLSPRSTLQSPRATGKYPVLQPLVPFLQLGLSIGLACDLLELYFTSAFSTHMHPVCHHIHCYVMRRPSFLNDNPPRPCTPALLASMLWVAAMHDRAFDSTDCPLQRKKTREFLSSLTIQLLKPITHTPLNGLGDFPNDVGSGCFAGSLDDVITYIHVASIVSASEQKATSMRWWYAAFTLARELKLNREIELISDTDTDARSSPPVHNCLTGWDIVEETVEFLHCTCGQGAYNIEEYREERRRTWWLLYLMDRHLALCYNRPLALLDAECKDLLLPLSDEVWQSGDIHSHSPEPNGPQCLLSGDKSTRRIFPDFTCHDSSIFGFFLPLMTIMGQLIELNQARNHPIQAATSLRREAWDAHFGEILLQLDIYTTSLNAFTESTSSQADPWHTQIVASYASYFVHVLHILLNGKWDLVSLIEDKDFWTSSPDFALTISHVLSAANEVEQILRLDPDVSFMPDFFGIQLLQGSFLLLLVVERLQKDAGECILSACDVMIRATEACIVTLDTEYQRSFRQVMRSAVMQARGCPINHGEMSRRHKAILALYRWTRTGTGLAL